MKRREFLEFEDRYDLPKHLPTESEIQLECEKIQATWTEVERRRRSPWLEVGQLEVLTAKETDLFGNPGR